MLSWFFLLSVVTRPTLTLCFHAEARLHARELLTGLYRVVNSPWVIQSNYTKRDELFLKLSYPPSQTLFHLVTQSLLRHVCWGGVRDEPFGSCTTGTSPDTIIENVSSSRFKILSCSSNFLRASQLDDGIVNYEQYISLGRHKTVLPKNCVTT